jgi:hypothetical protein
MYCRLIFCSKAVNFSHEGLVDIFKKSVYNNYLKGIRGCLLVIDEKQYLQVLEGPYKKVNELFRKIQLDNRNRDVCLISYEKIKSLELKNWNARVLVDGSSNINLYTLIKPFLFENIGLDPNIPKEIVMKMVAECDIDYSNFGNTNYNFKLITDLFNSANDDNLLTRLNHLNQYNFLYDDVYRKNISGSMGFLKKLEEHMMNISQ